MSDRLPPSGLSSRFPRLFVSNYPNPLVLLPLVRSLSLSDAFFYVIFSSSADRKIHIYICTPHRFCLLLLLRLAAC
jgi:hypothetical protein